MQENAQHLYDSPLQLCYDGIVDYNALFPF